MTDSQPAAPEAPIEPTSATLVAETQAEAEPAAEDQGPQEPEYFSLSIVPPSGPKIPIRVMLTDNVQDIKQMLCEVKELCYATSYTFIYQNLEVPDFADLATLPDLQEGSEFQMLESAYTPFSSQMHIRRLRDILKNEPQEPLSVLSALTQQIEKELIVTNQKKPQPAPVKKPAAKKGKKGKKGKKNTQHVTKSTPKAQPAPAERLRLSIKDTDCESSLKRFFPAGADNGKDRLQCVHSIAYSGWNPPPADRTVKGDLAYLVVRTMENQTLHITSAVNFFYINKSTDTRFNPAPADNTCFAHTLVEVLEAASPAFKKGFGTLLDNYFMRHPYEVIPVPLPESTSPWLHNGAPHTLDYNRSELFLTGEDTMIFRDQLRDWNAEYQACRELPSSTREEVIIRDRATTKIVNEFVMTATAGAKAVASGSALSINPMEPPEAQLFIFNNIFFSYAKNGRFLFEEPDGEMGPYKLVNNDLKGVQSVNSFELKGIHTILTALVNYGPSRMVAQSIIPGILSQSSVQFIEYGSSDHGKTLTWNEDFYKSIKQIGDVLRVPEHVVEDTAGNQVKMCCSTEIKGVRGTDNKQYILDLEHITARDPNWEENWAVLRLELYDVYTDFLKHRHFLTYKDQYEEAGRARAAKIRARKEKEAAGETVPPLSEEEEADDLPGVPKFVEPTFNPNAYGLLHGKLVGTEEEVKAAEDQIKEIGNFLVSSMIPTLANRLVGNVSVPSDSATLVALFHDHGVNMRYLGRVATLLKDNKPFMKDLLVREMIVRASKHLLRRCFGQMGVAQYADGATHFLNCFVRGAFLQNLVSLNGSPNEPLIAPKFGYDPVTLWEAITVQVKTQFRYELSRGEFKAAEYAMPAVRQLCQCTGVRLLAKEYDMYSITPFLEGDMMGLFPVVKGPSVTNNHGRNLIENAKALLLKNHLEMAYEFLTEALTLFHQIHGPMHPLSAWCYSHLAAVLDHVGDEAQSLIHQSKALIILERTQGLDYYETAYGYRSLGLYYHHARHPALAFGFLKRALYLCTLIGGRKHPDNSTTLVSMGAILQENHQLEDAITIHNRALEVFEYHGGSVHPAVASCHHQIAVCYALNRDYRTATLHQRKNMDILAEVYGEKDARVLEAKVLLNNLVATAAERDAENRTLPQLPTAAAALHNDDSIGTLPIQDILKYINNSDDSSRLRGSRFKQAKY